MASILDVGISGLRVNQAALQVTGNNIANADDASYTRQSVQFTPNPEQFTGGGFIGSGSSISAINRVSDEFVLKQMRLDTSNYFNLAAFGNNIEQLDSLLAGELSSLGPSVTAFFKAIEVGAEDPTSIPARQLVLSESQGLVERLHTLYDRLQQQSHSVNDQLSSLTSQVTSLSKGIAELNDSITTELSRGDGSKPNGLLDKRDELVRQLSEIVSVSVTTANDGAINVFAGSGQSLVVGSVASGLGVRPSATNPELSEITYVGAGQQVIPITDAIKGGSLGGLLRFRDETLESTLNDLGRIALAMTDSMNQQNKQGLDLEGNFGGTIFQDINTPSAMADRAKTLTTGSTTSLNVSINDISKLSADNYKLTVTDGASVPVQASLVNQTSKEVIAGTFVGGAFVPNDPNKTEGIEISVGSGTLATNESFFIRPTRSGARDAEVQMNRPQELAFAAPIATTTPLANRGGGTISAGNVLEAVDRVGNVSPAFVTPGALTPPVLIRFTSATTYDVLDNTNPSNPVALSPPMVPMTGITFTPGQSNPVFPEDSALNNYTGYQVNLSGSPAAGDTFTVGFNSEGISDNRNGVALGQLRTTGTIDGGAVNFEDSYGRLVEEVGAATAQNRVSSESSLSLLQASTASRSSVSGVNLDEEAANLIKFEQAYNASAQVINVARQIFDTLLSSFR